jgi:hypothetical protein
MEQRQLKRAREAIAAARETTGGPVMEQLGSLEEGLHEEDEGDDTPQGPGPKMDRVAEIYANLGKLEDEIEQSTTRDHIAEARAHLNEYMRAHPQGS